MQYTFARSAIIAGFCLAGAVFAQAQTSPANPHAGMDMAHAHAGMAEHGAHDSAKMQARFAKHLADLKTRLQLTPAQEGAWISFADSMKLPATRPAMPNWKDMDKLGTVERIDKMHAMRVERNAKMDQHEAAIKSFYATLSPSQQKVFDLEHSQMHRRMQGGHGMMPWHHEGSDMHDMHGMHEGQHG